MSVATISRIIPACSSWVADQMKATVIPAINADLETLSANPVLFNTQCLFGEPIDVFTPVFAISFASVGDQEYIASGGIQILTFCLKLSCIIPASGNNSTTDFEAAMQYSASEFVNYWDNYTNTLSPEFVSPLMPNAVIQSAQTMRSKLSQRMPYLMPNDKTAVRGWSCLIAFKFTSSNSTLPASSA